MLEHPFTENQETEFKSYLESIGDSIVVVADDEIVKVHVHTNDPGMAMQRGLTYGSLTTIIIENMRLERDEKISAMKEKEMQNTANAENEIRAAEENEQEVPAEEKEMGFISVSIGEGINEIFRGLGVDYIIEGGQTMNPRYRGHAECYRSGKCKYTVLSSEHRTLFWQQTRQNHW